MEAELEDKKKKKAHCFILLSKEGATTDLFIYLPNFLFRTGGSDFIDKQKGQVWLFEK